MAKKGSKLLSALDRHRGRDIKKELVQKQQKEVTKRKQRTKQQKLENDGGKEDKSEDKEVDGKSAAGVAQWAKEDEDAPGWETDDIDEEDTEEGRYGDLSARLDDSDTSSESELDTAGLNPIDGEIEPEEDEEDIPLSDLDSLASEDRGDVVPKQRLTINNTAALTRSLRSIALPLQSLPFSEHQTITNPTPTQITDVEDDLSRELAFYKQSLDSVTSARRLLRAEKQPFSRPADYFAEMVKNDEHMGRVKAKLVDEAAGKKAAAEARKQRDLKKFGKQVQVAKMQERSKVKKDMLEKVNILKRKRQGAEVAQANEEDLFDVALEDAGETAKKDRASRRDASAPSSAASSTRPNPAKRQKKDAKFGYGGKKRFAKSGDAMSSADMKGFSTRKMKGQKKKGAAPRPGKSKRQQQKMR